MGCALGGRIPQTHLLPPSVNPTEAFPSLPGVAPTELLICVTCRPQGAPRDGLAAGQALLDETLALWRDDACAVRVRSVACMNGCERACTAALQAPGKTTYFFGGLQAHAETAAQLLECARLHARRADGLMARNERPQGLRGTLLAKLPAYPTEPR